MPDELFKLLDYGFAIFVGVSLLCLAVWIIRRLIGGLERQADAINSIMTNHLPHLHEACTKMGEKVESLESTSTQGFDRVVASIDKGMERQANLLDKVLAAKCPLLEQSKDK